MHLHPSVGKNPKIPGEISRPPEIGACGLISLNLFYMAKASEVHPVFPLDNAFDRSGQCWCARCGWKGSGEFYKDSTRSKQQAKTVFRRYCKECVKVDERNRRKERKKWKRG